MQGMIMHHGQAVEMTAMIEARTQNKQIRLIGAKISQSQSDEINLMIRWLEMRGEKMQVTFVRTWLNLRKREELAGCFQCRQLGFAGNYCRSPADAPARNFANRSCLTISHPTPPIVLVLIPDSWVAVLAARGPNTISLTCFPSASCGDPILIHFVMNNVFLIHRLLIL